MYNINDKFNTETNDTELTSPCITFAQSLAATGISCGISIETFQGGKRPECRNPDITNQKQGRLIFPLSRCKCQAEPCHVSIGHQPISRTMAKVCSVEEGFE